MVGHAVGPLGHKNVEGKAHDKRADSEVVLVALPPLKYPGLPKRHYPIVPRRHYKSPAKGSWGRVHLSLLRELLFCLRKRVGYGVLMGQCSDLFTNLLQFFFISPIF